MARTRTAKLAACCGVRALALIVPMGAWAAPGNSTTLPGSVEVAVVDPVGIQPVAPLRFGRIIRPTTAGTITINPDDSFTTTGGVTANATTPQAVNGRGRSAFAVFGDPNRLFIRFLPNTITISNGASTMTVNQFASNAGFLARFDASGYYALFVGAQLNVGANQQVGTYSGTFDVTVLYL